MINLRVYQPDKVELSEEEARELTFMAKGKKSRREPRVISHVGLSAEKGWYDVTPGPFVGRFSLRSGRTVDIASRFPFQDLVVLLGFGHQTRLLSETATPGFGGAGLVDLIGLAFAREAERIIGFGLEKGYAARAVTKPPFAGVPDVAAHLAAHAGRPDRLVTKVSRLTADIPINRLIANALRRLSPLRYQDDRLSARLRALVPAFQQITQLAGTPAIPPANRVPRRYQDIYQLTLLVLDEHTTLPTGAGVAGVNVLFNMTKIWEAYVRAWLEHGLQPGQRLAFQHTIQLADDRSDLKGHPDYVVFQGPKPVAVYDAKYKDWKDRPTTDELYQLVTYAHRLAVRQAALVYPARVYKTSRTTVGTVTIDTIGLPVTNSLRGSVVRWQRAESASATDG